MHTKCAVIAYNVTYVCTYKNVIYVCRYKNVIYECTRMHLMYVQECDA
jgi:hypothetical protein